MPSSPKPFPVASRLIDEADQKHSYELHQHKLGQIKPTVDNTTPAHWSPARSLCTGKKAVQQAEAANEIEKNNRLLLEKLVRIQSMSSRTTIKPPTERSGLRAKQGVVRDSVTGARMSDHINFHMASNRPGGSAHARRACKEAEDIQTMNAKIGMAIMNIKPYYSSEVLDAQHVQEQEMMQRISSFRPNALASPGAGHHSPGSIPASPVSPGRTIKSVVSGAWSSPGSPRADSTSPSRPTSRMRLAPLSKSESLGSPLASPRSPRGDSRNHINSIRSLKASYELDSAAEGAQQMQRAGSSSRLSNQSSPRDGDADGDDLAGAQKQLMQRAGSSTQLSRLGSVRNADSLAEDLLWAEQQVEQPVAPGSQPSKADMSADAGELLDSVLSRTGAASAALGDGASSEVLSPAAGEQSEQPEQEAQDWPEYDSAGSPKEQGVNDEAYDEPAQQSAQESAQQSAEYDDYDDDEFAHASEEATGQEPAAPDEEAAASNCHEQEPAAEVAGETQEEGASSAEYEDDFADDEQQEQLVAVPAAGLEEEEEQEEEVQGNSNNVTL